MIDDLGYREGLGFSVEDKKQDKTFSNVLQGIFHLKTTLLLRFLLLFVKPEYEESPGDVLTLSQPTAVIYKRFRGRIYIIKSWIKQEPHPNCRCGL